MNEAQIEDRLVELLLETAEGRQRVLWSLWGIVKHLAPLDSVILLAKGLRNGAEASGEGFPGFPEGDAEKLKAAGTGVGADANGAGKEVHGFGEGGKALLVNVGETKDGFSECGVCGGVRHDGMLREGGWVSFRRLGHRETEAGVIEKLLPRQGLARVRTAEAVYILDAAQCRPVTEREAREFFGAVGAAAAA